ncbi:hypothetical protein BHM03_00002225 [Ensete ventricosum]|nr:hypothetical protein BHM03_00002225 [Ensete ventricosum]
MPKRSARSPAPEQAASARPGKQVKVMVRKHKSHHGEGSSQGNTREKEPIAPSEEDSLPTYRRPKSMKDLYGTRVRKDDEGYYFGRGVLHPNLAKELYTLPFEVLMAEATEQIVLQLEQAEELNEAQAALEDNQRQLKKQKANRRKVDDDLPKIMKENETLKTELSSKCITDYKQSVGFGWGLRRMGQVSYKYGYKVALAHFQARYPDLEVDNDPFIEKLKDNSVPMETR